MNNSEQPIYPDPMRGADYGVTNQEPHKLNQGLTKREYFAGLAMQGLIANAPHGHLANSKEGCELATQWADALLTELSKTK